MIKIPHLKDKTVAVLGLGRSGMATCFSLKKSGAKVIAWDDAKSMQEEAKRHQIEIADLACLTPTVWQGVSFLVVAPGIPLHFPKPHAVIVAAKKQGVQVIGDVDLLLQACPQAKFVGVTGTNGKSTTVSLLYHLLNKHMKHVALGGNIGTPVLSLPAFGKEGVYILELSSYQLDLLDKKNYPFHASVLLNITPDHLDRHKDMAGYIEVKKKIFMESISPSLCIVGNETSYTAEIAQELEISSKNVSRISGKRKLSGKQDVYVEEGVLHFKEGGREYTFNMKETICLEGEHNGENTAAAVAVALSLGMSAGDIFIGLKTFPGLVHRQQLAGNIKQVSFFNDSKATNADATAVALKRFENIYWILGGVAKEGGIASLKPFFSKIKHAFLIGEAEQDFSKTLQGVVPYTLCHSLSRAVEEAYQLAKKDENHPIILFSPACASFDQFANFEERGKAFCKYVQEVGERVIDGKG